VANSDQAESIALTCLQSGMSIERLYGGVIAPSMWRIGQLWEKKAITVVDEHLATAITLRVMARIYGLEIKSRMSRPGRVLLAATEGQRHEIGLRMAGDVLEFAGYDVIYLGGDVPTASLLESVRRFEPDLVGISTILASNMSRVEWAVMKLAEQFPDTPVVLGGPAVSEAALAFDGVERSETVEDLPDMVGRLLVEWGIASDRQPQGPESKTLPTSLAAEEESPEGHMLQIVADFTEEVRAQARLVSSYRQLAYEDVTTAGPNRRAFDYHLEELNRNSAAQPVCLMVLDIDSFKLVNDSLGHEDGDRLLREVAGVIDNSLRDGDFSARLGGDEFGVLLPVTQTTQAEVIANRILESVRKMDRANPIAATIGISRLEGDTRQALIRADTALYEAKAAGKDRVAVAGHE